MPLRETLQTILTNYPKAKSEPLEGHPLEQFIRGDAEGAVQEALGELGTGLLAEGSPGQGNWAAVPWISVFDPAITTSATCGYYVVYLFHAHDPVVCLSLNQGTTAVREEFAGKARDVLADRAEFMRKRVADYCAMLRKIERNRTAAKQAKKFHGTICQACDLDFEKRYGAIGKGFIEAHHLKPIATLVEGVSVTYDVASDFAVLCANCHRMIHRSNDPSDLNKFRAIVQSNKS